MFVSQVTVRQQDLEVGIEGEKCLQQVLLVPVQLVLVVDAWILARQADVVHMDQHPRCKARQDFEELVLNVTARAQHVAGVDEQDVVGAQGGGVLPLRQRPLRHLGGQVHRHHLRVRLHHPALAQGGEQIGRAHV